jgi:hypothetical protein
MFQELGILYQVLYESNIRKKIAYIPLGCNFGIGMGWKPSQDHIPI